MINNSILNGFKFGIGLFLAFFFIFGLSYAGSHLASQVLSGTFLGNFIFQGNTSFNGSVDFSNSSILGLSLLNQTQVSLTPFFIEPFNCNSSMAGKVVLTGGYKLCLCNSTSWGYVTNQSKFCDWDGIANYTTLSGNSNYAVTLPKDGTAYYYTIGTAKNDGFIRFEIQRVGDTYAYGGILINDKFAFFPREYGVIDSDVTINDSPRYFNYWVETGVNTENNGASGYADIKIYKDEVIKIMGHRSTMTITGNIEGFSSGWN